MLEKAKFFCDRYHTERLGVRCQGLRGGLYSRIAYRSSFAVSEKKTQFGQMDEIAGSSNLGDFEGLLYITIRYDTVGIIQNVEDFFLTLI